VALASAVPMAVNVVPPSVERLMVKPVAVVELFSQVRSISVLEAAAAVHQ
jgi:hypothetical protein